MVKDFVQRAPAAVHEELGGMGGDQKMLRWLARHPSDQNRIGKEGEPGCGSSGYLLRSTQGRKTGLFSGEPRDRESTKRLWPGDNCSL